jgi:hypothetical protein
VGEVFDKDGRVETLILLDNNGSMAEVFERKNDGTIRPVGSGRLKEIKEAVAFVHETFAPIVDGAMKGTEKKEMLRLIEDAARKAQRFGQESAEKASSK